MRKAPRFDEGEEGAGRPTQRWFAELTQLVSDVLDVLGLWRSDGWRRDVPATGAVRSIARRAQVASPRESVDMRIQNP